MIIVKLMGGLGNQMFQFAAAKALADFHNTSIKVDLSFLLDRSPKENFTFREFDLDIFNLSITKAKPEEVKPFLTRPNKFVRALYYYTKLRPSYNYYYEKSFHYNPNFFNLPNNSYIEGYWQSPLYFAKIEKQIRTDFTFKEPIINRSLELSQLISKTDSICVNVRRTDFLSNNYHGVCDMNYYNPSMEKMSGLLSDPHFFIFTDDHEWAKNNFKSQHPITFIGPEHNGNKFSNKFQLMTLCKNFIIPNSSFAWWAAYLSTHPDKIVIGPSKWFADHSSSTKDLRFGNWITIEN